MRVLATFAGFDCNNNALLLDVEIRDERKVQKLDHRWINGQRGNFPLDVPMGSRVQFFASPLHRKGGAKLTDCREVEVI
jgi:hypothetical protein